MEGILHETLLSQLASTSLITIYNVSEDQVIQYSNKQATLHSDKASDQWHC